MPAFQHIPLSIIEPIAPQNLAQGGAMLGQVPAWNGANYVPENPVSWLNAGTLLGKISEVNILGSGVSSNVAGNRATLTINAGAVTVNGQAVTAINPGANISASIVGGVATLNAVSGGNITMQNGDGTPLLMNPGTGNLFSVKGLFAGAGIQLSDFGTQVMISATGSGYTHPNYQIFSYEPSLSGGFVSIPAIYTDGIGSVTQVINRVFTLPSGSGTYTHPSYTPQAFTPSLVGNTLTVHSITTDGIGSVTGVTPFSFALPTSGGGGITGISLNGVGNYTNIQFGGGFSVSGNTVTAIGAGHTIGNGALGAGIVSVPGFAASHTLKGLVGGGATTVTDMGSHILISSTAGGGGTGTVEVRYNGVTVNPAAAIINFIGAGVTNVANGVGVEVTIPGASGGGGIAGVSVNGVGTYTNLIFNGAGVSVSGNQVTVLGGGASLPFGNTGETFVNTGGSTWAATAKLLHGATTTQIIRQVGATQAEISVGDNGAIGMSATTDITLFPATNLFLGMNPTTATENVYVGRLSGAGTTLYLNCQRIGFFGKAPIARPDVVSGNLTALMNALKDLGIINII